MKQLSIWWVYLATAIAVAGVVIHVGAVFGGPSWFAFFNAPPGVVASARAGTWLAPVSASIIAGLMAVCLLRALALPPLAVGHPELRNTFEVVSALIWLAAGVGFAVGFRITKPGPNNSFKPKPLRSSAKFRR